MKFSLKSRVILASLSFTVLYFFTVQSQDIPFPESASSSIGDSTDFVIMGRVLTEDQKPVGKVKVILSNPVLQLERITSSDGTFSFYLDEADTLFTLRAERNDNPRNGVSTLDIIRLLKHLLGIEPLVSPYDIIAADANNSKSLSAIDLIEVRKLILGIYSEFPNNKSWRFVSKASSNSEIIKVTGSGTNYDFIGIKIGDLNNTVNPN
ncbi:MAG: hypothetical protein ABJB16_17005 [Saprospiraceae bacterium]